MPRPAAICLLCLFCLASAPIAADDRENWTSYPAMNYVTALAEADDLIYVATTGGIRRYDRFAKRWRSPLTTRDGLPHNEVLRMVYEPATGDLWFETRAGTGRWLSRLEIFMLGGAIPSNLQRHVVPEIPPVFPPFGYYLDPNRIIGPRRDVAITDAMIDSWRILWIGTWGMGVGMADLNDRQLQFMPSGPLTENVTALAKDGDAIWIGGENTFAEPARGVSRFNTRTGAWDYFEADHIIGFDDAQIAAILPDSQNVWFGTHNGLMRYDRRADRWLTYRDTRFWGRINALARDGDVVWVGSDRGLALLDARADSIDLVSGSENAVIHALVTGPQAIWAGTEGGLFRCTRGERAWRSVRDSSDLAKRSVRALAISGSELWIATEYPAGLLCYHTENHTWREYPLAEINSGRHIAIAADGNRVWAGTASGAFLFDVQRRLWTRYTPVHGLIHAQVQAVLHDDARVWFGTAEGLCRFDWRRALFLENE